VTGPDTTSSAPTSDSASAPPTAPQQAYEHVSHGVSRPDPYAWMSADTPALQERLLSHLAAERGWYDLSTAHLGSLSGRLRSEMEARVPELQRSGTWSRPRFFYYSEDERNRDYPVVWRESRNNFAPGAAKSPAEGSSREDSAGSSTAEVVLDVNSLDAGSGYLDLGFSIVSPDEHLLAYAVDTTGDEVFTLRFRDLRTGRDLPDVVDNVHYSGAWTTDSAAFAYAVPDDAWRPDEIRLHRLGTEQADDVSLLREPDRKCELSVRLSRSEGAILVRSESRDTGECWYVDPTGVDLEPRSLGGRRRGVIYRAEHVRGKTADDPG